MITSTQSDSRALSQPISEGLLAHMMVLTHFVQKHTMESLTAGQRYQRLSLAYVDYVTCLAEGDHSPGELADRLGISKQACSKIVRELEQQQFIERRTNPADSRSSLLSLTDRGLQLVQDGIEATNGIQQQFARQVGAGQLKRLIRVLEKLCLTLQISLPALHALEAASRRPARLSILVTVLSMHFREQLGDSIRNKGFRELRSGVGQVLGMISREGRRLQYIASILGVSKQAVAATALELEQQGYTRREPDPVDKRQVILHITPLGQRLLTEAIASVREIERSIETRLGHEDYLLLDSMMAIFYAQVAAEYDTASVLRNRIHQLSRELLDELGVTGARALAQQLMSITRGRH